MKVDVYPNITNVEVYENPISVPVEATWEKVVFTVPDPVVASYDLGRKVATDRDGDYVIQLHYNATVQQYGTDFRIDGTNVVWISEVDLAAGEELIVWYSPQSAYGSVPGSGEVTSLTHLNDVTIEGPLAGDMLMRNADGQFVNRKLTAGDNVTIVSDGDGVTISSLGGGGGAVVSASTITEGTVRLSTIAEAAGNSDALAVTPAALQNQLATLSAVAQSGQYNDLLGKPALSTVATSGSYNDLDNKPVIPNTQGASGAVNVSDGNGGFSEVTWEVSNNHLLPTADDVYDIGSATQRVRDLYIGAQSIKIGDNNIPLGIDANGELTFGQTNVLTDASLADVATTGSYADLIGAPTLSGVATSGAYGDLLGAPTLSSVATSGAYADLSGAPTLSNVATSGAYADLINAPTLSSVATTGSYADLIGAPTLSNVATSGAYADLSGTPTISTVGASGSYADLIGAPTLSSVATSGSYTDLSDKPAIPSASTDLTDSADLARLNSPSLTGTPTAPTPLLGDDSNKIATTAFVQDEITNLGGVNSLDDLSDVVLSATLNAGEVLRYDGANFIDAPLASTDLSDSGDLARLASPSFSGTPTAPTAVQGDNTNKLATTSYVQTEIANMSTVGALTDLTDVSLSGTLTTGEVLRYDGASFVDAQLASTDLSDSGDLARTANLGTAASEDVGTAIGDVVQLVDVSGSASLPLIDASQLTGITASQVGALADITNESLNDLGDVNFTAGATIDGYSLIYNHSNTRWEAAEVTTSGTTVLLDNTNVSQIFGTNRAEITAAAGTTYIIDLSVEGIQFLNYIVFILPSSGVDDPTSIKIVNLSSLTIYAWMGASNRLFDALGNAAPYGPWAGKTGYAFQYLKGTVNLHQSDVSSTNAKWYAYFDYPINQNQTTSEGDGIAYSEADLAYINAGQVFGDYVITANVNQITVRAGRRYVTADNETVDRTVFLPNTAQSESLCDALDGRLMYFENRGTANLRIDPVILNAPNQDYWAYMSELDGTGQVSYIDLKSGESAAVRVERVNNNMFYRYIRQGFIPARITETVTATSTISTGTEHHKVLFVDNGATAITLTVPESADLRSGYQLTLKVLGTGAVTVSRSGTDTFDGDTSLTLGQNEALSLIASASGWAVLHNDAASVSVTADDVVAPHTGVSYTAANTDSVTTHLSAIDTALGNIGGSSSSQIKRVSGNYTVTTADVEAKLQIIYTGTADTWTVTLPDFSSLLSSDSVIDGSAVDSVEMSIARDRIGEITLIATNGVGLFNDGSSTYSTKTVASGEWVKLIGYLDASSVARWTAENDRALWTLVDVSNNVIAEAGRYYQATASLTITLRENRFLDGQLVHIHNTSNSNVTLTPNLIEKINGSTNDYILGAGEWVTLVHDKSAVDFKVQYASVSSGGSAPSVTVLSGNATENLSAPSGNEEVYILAQADVDVYMVSASSAGEGFKYHFKYTADGGYYFNAATINVNASSSDTIDDGSLTSVDIANIYDALTLVSDGTSKWYII